MSKPGSIDSVTIFSVGIFADVRIDDFDFVGAMSMGFFQDEAENINIGSRKTPEKVRYIVTERQDIKVTDKWN